MLPPRLKPLFAPVTTLRGVGPAVQAAMKRLFGKPHPELRDLLFHLPVSLIDRRNNPPLTTVPPGCVITTSVKIEAHLPPPIKGFRRAARIPYKIMTENETGTLMLVFYNVKGDYLAKQLPVGEWRALSGKTEFYDGHLTMTHPDRIEPAEKLTALQSVEAVYPLTYALTNRQISWYIKQALEKLPAFNEWQDETVMRTRGWPRFVEAIRQGHHPQTETDLQISAPSRERLASDELLAGQLALALIRRHEKKPRGLKVKALSLMEKVRQLLPYQLTQAQEVALADIVSDLQSGERMLRLLQGDVGSGKTVVGLLAMLAVVEAGAQCALLVPTELVAAQHYRFIEKTLAGLGVNICLLTGRIKPAARKPLLADIASGKIQIIIGTHAIFQDNVSFSNLAFAIMDEQHRFGVKQRLALTDKGLTPHLLLMTATPIPRSLAMTAYGDMDVSAIREKPPGRKPIDTRAIPLSRLKEVVQAVVRAADAGERVYWVCPLIEEGEEGTPAADLAAAEARYETLKPLFGERVALMHGRMKEERRDEAMRKFAGGEVCILVATTVIEVGVDVPEATIMVIEHAERFGLAQLHQLRGRVGRGSGASRCLLLYADRAGETARSRLTTMRETEDGFAIAEQDMQLRGFGEVLGTRQSGMPGFRFADLSQHQEILSMAHADVKLILHRDPELKSARGDALRELLYLFGQHENIRYLTSG